MSLPSMILYGRKKQLFITKEKKNLEKKKGNNENRTYVTLDNSM